MGCFFNAPKCETGLILAKATAMHIKANLEQTSSLGPPRESARARASKRKGPELDTDRQTYREERVMLSLVLKPTMGYQSRRERVGGQAAQPTPRGGSFPLSSSVSA